MRSGRAPKLPSRIGVDKQRFGLREGRRSGLRYFSIFNVRQRERRASPSGVPSSESIPTTARSRFVINVGYNAGYVALNTALMMWYISFLVHQLGVSAFGMITLANSLVMFATIFSGSLVASISRFLAIDLNQGNDDAANRTFNTSLALTLIVSGILLLPAAVIVYFLPVLFNVPIGLEVATQWLFVGVGMTILTAMIGSPFGVVSVITHRFDLYNVARSIVSLSRVCIVVSCFTLWSASLWYVTLAFIVSAFIGLIAHVMICRLLAPQLHFNSHAIDSHRFRELLPLSGWSAINQIGFMLLMRVDVLVVNAVFGAVMTGRYGALLLFPLFIYMLSETVTTVLSPAVMVLYAKGDAKGLRLLASQSVKILGIGLALPVGLLCGLGYPLLNLWLGPEFADLDFLLIMLVGYLAFNLATKPLAAILTAYNRVKVQGLVTLGLGIAYVILVIALALWSGWGVVGIAAAGAIVWTIRNVVFLSSYAAFVMDLRWWAFYWPVAIGMLSTLCISLAGKLVAHFWLPKSWPELFLCSAAIGTAYLIIAYATVLNRENRDLLWSLLTRRALA